MKNATLLLISCFMSIFMFGQDLNLTNVANLGRYAEANLSSKGEVVFIGNSITEGWVNMRPDFFIANNYIGRGIGGQTSPQLLLRFRQDVINLKPAVVVINIGTNDIAENTGKYNPQFTMDCIRSMAEIAKCNEIKVILSSVLPAGEFGWRKEIKDAPQKIDALNEQIKAYAEASGFAYIDYNSLMRDENGALRNDLGNDGVHPNEKGYEIMEQAARKVIDKVF